MLPDTSLLYFHEVAKTGSVRQAAEQLHISASAISRMIKKVEHRFRATLFERRADGMALTPAGQLLARQLSGVAAQIKDAEMKISELQGLRRGEVKLHCIDAAAQELAPRFLAEFHRRYPDITFVVRSGSTEEIVESLRSYASDIGITYNMGREESIDIVHAYRYKLYVLVAPAHPLARKRKTSLQEIASHRVAMPEPSFGIRQVLDRALQARNIDVPMLLTTNSLGLARGMACEGVAVTLSSRFASRPELASKRLVAIPLVDSDSLTGTMSVCKRAERELSASATEMLQHIAKYCPKSDA